MFFRLKPADVKPHWLVLVLGLIWLCIVIFNVDLNSWIVGWDSVHPEFNFSLNVQRELFGLWQEYRGLGLVAGMAEISDITRVFLLWLVSFVVPGHWLRWLWMMGMLLVGSLGAYVFVGRVVKKDTDDDSMQSRLSGFIGGLFYLLNFATVHAFYVPLETFVSFYGFFPWLLLTAAVHLQRNNRRSLVLFGVIAFLAGSSFYVQTLFVVMFLTIFTLILSTFIHNCFSKRSLFAGLSLLITLISVNAYWILPIGYSAMNKGNVPLAAKTNQLSTPETIRQNEARGTLFDFILLKGYQLDAADVNLADNSHTTLMGLWADWMQKPWVNGVGLILWAMVVMGIVGVLFRQSHPQKYVGVFWLLLISLMLLRQVEPFPLLYEELVLHVPLFGQIFRSAYTKWSLVAALTYALGLGLFTSVVLEETKKQIRITSKVVVAFISAGIIVVSIPIFSGGLVYSQLKMNIPQVYFALFDWFGQQQPQARIVSLPIHSMWGWNYYSWGYRGSGFLWYGIEQPILDRAFDVWSGENEGFYLEASTALYGCPRLKQSSGGVLSVRRALDLQDDNLRKCAWDVGRVLDKYDVTYVLLDESIVAPGRANEILRHEETKAVMHTLGWKKVFHEQIQGENDKSLIVWQRSQAQTTQNQNSFVFSPQSYTPIVADTVKVRRDVIYGSVDTYIERASPSVDTTTLPFANVLREEIEGVSIANAGFSADEIRIGREVSVPQDRWLTLPTIKQGMEMPVLVSAQFQSNELMLVLRPAMSLSINNELHQLPELARITYELQTPLTSLVAQINQQTVALATDTDQEHLITLVAGEPVSIELFDAQASGTIELPQEIVPSQVSQCWTREGQAGKVVAEQQEGYSTIRVVDASGCVSYPLGKTQEDALLRIRVAHRSLDGARPHFCVDALGGEYVCEHESVYEKTPPSSEWATVERFVRANQGTEYFLDLTARPADEINQQWSIDYQSPQVEELALLAHSELTAEFWTSVIAEKDYPLPAGEQAITFVMTQEPLLLAPLFSGRGTNCDVFRRGSVTGKQTSDGMVMTATHRASMCASVAAEGLPLNQAYMLRLQGKNVSGRGLKFYMSNWVSDRADLEYLLDEGSFDQVFGLLSWPHIHGKGYSLNFETRSFGSDTAQNVLARADVYAAPLDWLSLISIRPKDGIVEAIANSLAVQSVSKTGTAHYLARLQGEGLVALLQGFDEGWLGYQLSANGCRMSDDRCQIKTFMPWFFGERLEHVKVNGWANGWIVPSDEQQAASGEQTIEPRTSNVVLLFWPQYLEWIGLGLAGITLMVLVLKRK